MNFEIESRLLFPLYFINQKMKAILIILIAFAAVTGAFSGLVMLINPNKGLIYFPLDLLKGEAFHELFLPGFLFAIMVGNMNLIALIEILQKQSGSYAMAMAAGSMTIIWMFLQMFFMAHFYWIHFLYLGIGVLIIVIAGKLKDEGRHQNSQHKPESLLSKGRQKRLSRHVKNMVACF